MATVTEDYVSFEIAKLLKENGFCGNTEHEIWYVIKQFSTGCIWNSCTYKVGDITREYNDDCCIPMPTLQMAMKWLREVHNLCLFVIPATIDETFRTGYALYPQCDSKWEWCASKNDRSKATFGVDINKKYCDSYEQACEEAIKYCLENLI